MARSRKKRPFAALCGGSQKAAKRCYNRSMRRGNRVREIRALERDDVVFRTVRETMSTWSMPQDGTRRYSPFGRERYGSTRGSWRDPAEYRRWFRWVVAK